MLLNGIEIGVFGLCIVICMRLVCGWVSMMVVMCLVIVLIRLIGLCLIVVMIVWVSLL